MINTVRVLICRALLSIWQRSRDIAKLRNTISDVHTGHIYSVVPFRFSHSRCRESCQIPGYFVNSGYLLHHRNRHGAISGTQNPVQECKAVHLSQQWQREFEAQHFSGRVAGPNLLITLLFVFSPIRVIRDPGKESVSRVRT